MVDFVGIRPKDGPPRILPATRADLDSLERVRPGRAIAVKAVFRRSVPHHRWYWGLVGVVADGLGIAPGTLHAQLKYEAGLVRRILTSQSFGVAVELESAAFAEMDETAFTAYRQVAVEILFKRYLPGVKRKSVYERVEELCGPRPW